VVIEACVRALLQVALPTVAGQGYQYGVLALLLGPDAAGAVEPVIFGIPMSHSTTPGWNALADVRLTRTGATVHVDADQTIFEALRGAGLRVPSYCESST
jgi:hypothetical protein